MKTKSLKAGDYAGTGAVVLGAIAGAILSRAGITAVHDPASTNALLKGNLPAKRIAIAGGGFVGASLIDGKDFMSSGLKGVGYGMAIMQAVDLATDLTSTKVANTGTKANRIMRGALGLGCPSDTPVWGGMGRTRARRKGMRMPATAEFYNNVVNAESIFDRNIQETAIAS